MQLAATNFGESVNQMGDFQMRDKGKDFISLKISKAALDRLIRENQLFIQEIRCLDSDGKNKIRESLLSSLLG